MKSFNISLILIGLNFIFCTKNDPEYIAPSLSYPAQNTSFYEFVDFGWLPNNHANNATADYSFTLVVSPTANFDQITFSYSAKVWNHISAPLPTFRTGQYYWKVIANYFQQTTNMKTTLESEVRSFFYTGNDGAIYVNSGKIGGLSIGTKSDPMQTIAMAISEAERRGLMNINIANNASQYVFIFPITSRIIFKGCYDPLTWIRNVATCSTNFSDAVGEAYYNINN